MKLNCQICQKEFNVKPYTYNKSKTKQFFCSKSCFGESMKLRKGKWNENHNFSYVGPSKYKGQKKPEYIGKKISQTKSSQSKITCEYCFKEFNNSSYTRYHGLNCKKYKNYITICPDDYNYPDFALKARLAYCKYHLDKNDGNISKTARKIDIQRSHLHNIINNDKEKFILSEKPLKLFSSKVDVSFLYNKKKKDFERVEKVNKAREEFLELTEDELYESMLPQYLYYMNIKESEYDKSDLIRLPLLIQHYKEINAEDKVEDLEELLETITNNMNKHESH